MSGGPVLGAGDWLILAVSVLLVGMGLYRIVFAGRIDEREEAMREAREAADNGPGGYRPGRMRLDARTEGLIGLGLGTIGIVNHLFFK